MQVSEKATGDLLVFIFVKFLLSFHKFVKVKVFLPLSELFSYIKCSSWKGSEGIESTLQGGITCGAIDEPRKTSKAIAKRVIINFRDKNVVIVRFRDKNVYR